MDSAALIDGEEEGEEDVAAAEAVAAAEEVAEAAPSGEGASTFFMMALARGEEDFILGAGVGGCISEAGDVVSAAAAGDRRNGVAIAD